MQGWECEVGWPDTLRLGPILPPPHFGIAETTGYSLELLGPFSLLLEQSLIKANLEENGDETRKYEALFTCKEPALSASTLTTPASWWWWW